MSDDEMAEVILQTGSIMGDELCGRCGTRFMVDFYCENGHMKPVRNDKPTTFPNLYQAGDEQNDNPTTGEQNPSREEIYDEMTSHIKGDNPTTSSSAKATADRGEWTVESVRDLVAAFGTISDVLPFGIIANAHNAALAAAWRKGHADAQAPALKRIDELHQQLAAERLKANQKEGAFMVASDANQKLREQLAAAVERIKVLEELCAESLAKIGGKPDDVEIYYDNRGGDTK